MAPARGGQRQRSPHPNGTHQPLKALWKSRLLRKPDAGNPHVRFDEGEGGGSNAAPSLLYCLLLSCFTFAAEEGKTPTLKQAKTEFERADKALNAAWEAVKKEFSPAAFAVIREEQRAWVEWRDHIASSPAYSGLPAEDEAARLQSAEYFSIAAGLAADRTAWLRGLLAKEAPETMTGRWIDSYGGMIGIVEKEGRLYFQLNVVRGPTAHVGELSGVAQWNESIGWFSDKGSDKSRTDETNLAFIHAGGKLKLAGAKTHCYHGARAYFEGEYVRTGALAAKEQAEVLKAGAGEAERK